MMVLRKECSRTKVWHYGKPLKCVQAEKKIYELIFGKPVDHRDIVLPLA